MWDVLAYLSGAHRRQGKDVWIGLNILSSGVILQDRTAQVKVRVKVGVSVRVTVTVRVFIEKWRLGKGVEEVFVSDSKPENMDRAVEAVELGEGLGLM